MINILHLDTEGGWGGSSISLFKIVNAINREKFKSMVICRKSGPIIKKYKSIKIKVEENHDLYSFSAKAYISNFKLFITTIPQFIFILRGILKLIKTIKKNNIDIIHLNFEGFFLVGLILKIFLALPIVVHFRSTIPFDSYAHKFISFIIVSNFTEIRCFIFSFSNVNIRVTYIKVTLIQHINYCFYIYHNSYLLTLSKTICITCLVTVSTTIVKRISINRYFY